MIEIKPWTEEIKLTNCRELSLVWGNPRVELIAVSVLDGSSLGTRWVPSPKIGQHEHTLLRRQSSASSNKIVLKEQANSFDQRTHHRKHVEKIVDAVVGSSIDARKWWNPV